MKKFVLTLVIIIVVIGGTAYVIYREHKNNISNTDVNSNAVTQNQVLTSPDDIGSLTPTPDGKAQIYTNNNLGIQMTVPKNWVLGAITNKDSIYFKDPVDAAAYYQTHKQEFVDAGILEPQSWINNYSTLRLNYYKDFQTWYDNIDMTLANPGCKMIRDCFIGNGENDIKEITINGVQGFEVIDHVGELTTSTTYIEHEGIYSIFYDINDVEIPDPLDEIGTLKFSK